jgi:hypothetical protein
VLGGTPTEEQEDPQLAGRAVGHERKR